MPVPRGPRAVHHRRRVSLATFIAPSHRSPENASPVPTRRRGLLRVAHGQRSLPVGTRRKWNKIAHRAFKSEYTQNRRGDRCTASGPLKPLPIVLAQYADHRRSATTGSCAALDKRKYCERSASEARQRCAGAVGSLAFATNLRGDWI